MCIGRKGQRQFWKNPNFWYVLVTLLAVIVVVVTSVLLAPRRQYKPIVYAPTPPLTPSDNTTTFEPIDDPPADDPSSSHARRPRRRPRPSRSDSSLSFSQVSVSAAAATSNPSDGGPVLCVGDGLPTAPSPTSALSALFSRDSHSKADSQTRASSGTAGVGSRTSEVLAIAGEDAPENRRAHRVNVKFRMDVDPIAKLAGALAELGAGLSGSGNGTSGSGNGTSGGVGWSEAAAMKVKTFLAAKSQEGWIDGKDCQAWFKDLPGMDEILSQVSKIYYGPRSRVLVLDFNSPTVAETVASAVQNMTDFVEVSSLDVQWKRSDAALAARGPNDPMYSTQWGLASVGVTDSPDRQTPGAWVATTGDKGIVVAVVDTGVDYTHPDLAANIWVNPGEIPGNGIDDDGNGLVDDYHGYNFVEGALNASDPMDDQWHGTHVSGIIGAIGNNELGVSGVATNVSIMALKVLDSSGVGPTSWHILALEYAMEMGAHILSASLGGYNEDPILNNLFQSASDRGMVLVAAAGNERTNTDVKKHYPSGGGQASLISVGASVPAGCIAGLSNYGIKSVDMVAPGIDIVSTAPLHMAAYEGYLSASGTSQATPFVAGAAALVLSYMKQNGRPYLGQGVEVKRLLMESARQDPLYTDYIRSGGSLDIGRTMMVAANTTFTPVPMPPPSSPSPKNSSSWVGMAPWLHWLCAVTALLALQL